MPAQESDKLLPRIRRILVERPSCESIPPTDWIAQLRRIASMHSDESTIRQAEVFKALSDPTRLRVARLLSEKEELCVCEIQMALELTQPLTSHHLNILRRSGVVKAIKKERWVHYKLNEGSRELLQLVQRISG